MHDANAWVRVGALVKAPATVAQDDVATPLAAVWGDGPLPTAMEVTCWDCDGDGTARLRCLRSGLTLECNQLDLPPLEPLHQRLSVPMADVIDAPMAHHLAGKSYTRSGYGSRLPTACKVRVGGRLYRVYGDCWGNAPSGPYIVRKGTVVWLDLT